MHVYQESDSQAVGLAVSDAHDEGLVSAMRQTSERRECTECVTRVTRVWHDSSAQGNKIIGLQGNCISQQFLSYKNMKEIKCYDYEITKHEVRRLRPQN